MSHSFLLESGAEMAKFYDQLEIENSHL